MKSTRTSVPNVWAISTSRNACRCARSHVFRCNPDFVEDKETLWAKFRRLQAAGGSVVGD